MTTGIKRGIALFFIGVLITSFSLSLSIVTFNFWFLRFVPKGTAILWESYMISDLLVGVVGVVVGVIGGFLIGIHWRELREALD